MLSTKKFKTGIKTEKFCKKFIEWLGSIKMDG